MPYFGETEFSDLKDSVTWSSRQLKHPKRSRIQSILHFVGANHSGGGDFGEDGGTSGVPVPVNFLKLAVDIYVRSLAARAPRVLISSMAPEMKSTAANLELAVNQIPAEINLTATFRRLVTEALFSIGVLKVGLHTVGAMLGHEYGEPFVDLVTLDDFIIDMSAKKIEAIQYIGNDYYPTHEEVMKSDYYDAEAKKNLQPETDHNIGEQGEKRAETVSVDESVQPYKKRLHMRDVWVPSIRRVCTYEVGTGKKMNEVELKSPRNGPYHILGFTDVPGNLLPLAPVSVWRDLHELGNTIFRKLGLQADGQKTVLGFQGGNEESVNNFQAARDGDGINYYGAEPRTLTSGGVNQHTLAFFLQCRDLYSYFAGNLDSLGGLAPLTETVGQDKLLSEASGAQLREMASRTISVAREVFRDLAWYEWNDPVKKRILEKPIPGMPGMALPVHWGRDARKGGYDAFDLEIDVFSMIDDSPNLKLQRLGLVFQQYILPLMPAIEAVGGQLDVKKLISLVSKYSDLPELREIVTFVEPSATRPPEQGLKPANTTRTYEHVSRPGGSRRGDSEKLQAALVGGSETSNSIAPGGP